MELSSLRIEQALHGYSDGHRLLAISVELSKEALRTMLILSDMSGPSMQEGFEEYITGYPIINADCYAFSKTWFAPEMSRPGCVWTHTLLIQNSIINSLDDLQILLSLFKRPQNQFDYSDYTKHISFQQILQAKKYSQSECHPLTADIISALYGFEKDYPVALISEESHVFDDTITALWSQQWPLLRQRFTFCTGSLSIRFVNGNSFDFQIIPFNQRRQFEREIKNLIIVDNNPSNRDYEPWISHLIDCLTKKIKISLYEFLRIFGGYSRYLLSRLIIFYNQLSLLPMDSDRGKNIISLFYRLFPNADESQTDLVLCILGRRLDLQESMLIGVSEEEMLFSLATYNADTIINQRYTNANMRAIHFSLENKTKAITLMANILQSKITQIGQEILNGITSVIDINDLLYILNTNHELIFTIAEIMPSLTINANLWQIAQADQHRLLKVIPIDKLSDTEISSLIIILIKTGDNSIGEEIFKKFGSIVIDALLECIDKKVIHIEDRIGWAYLLRNNPGIALAWLKQHSLNNPKTLSFIVSAIDPIGEISEQANVDLWAKLLCQFQNNINDQDAKTLSCFLMPIALKNNGNNADYIAEYAFPYVYNALLKKQLSWRIWKILEPLLPEQQWYWFKSWDKCERLIIAMVKRGLKYNI